MKLLLWCALAIDPVYDAANPNQRMVAMFVIENRSAGAADFTKLKTRLSIDGKPLENWDAVVASGVEASWKSVPPGKYLQFGVNLTDRLRTPGAHTLKLTGDCSSNEARVLTKGQK